MNQCNKGDFQNDDWKTNHSRHKIICLAKLAIMRVVNKYTSRNKKNQNIDHQTISWKEFFKDMHELALCTESKERLKREAGSSRLGGGRFNMQENLPVWLALGVYKMNRSLFLPTRILKVYRGLKDSVMCVQSRSSQ